MAWLGCLVLDFDCAFVFVCCFVGLRWMLCFVLVCAFMAVGCVCVFGV